MADDLITVRHLDKIYNFGKSNQFQAVFDINFSIKKGETFVLVGESGSGKSTTSRILLDLDQPTHGNVFFEGQDISKLSKKERTKLHKKMSVVFQNPTASLNPRMTIQDIIGRGIKIHGLAKTKAELAKRIKENLLAVGLDESYLKRNPLELSGGQAQRVGIARALAVEPEFLVADEAISALDVSIQAQIVNLLIKLKKSRDLTYLFIIHDLSMAKYLGDRIAVMDSGHLVELASAQDIFDHPMHPYTINLLNAIPSPYPLERQTKSKRERNQRPYAFLNKKADDRQMHEISPGHFLYCTDDEAATMISLNQTEAFS
ncbi:MAG: ABC transporter ATP-binding protein [Oenococcus sp.]|uniref:ATP-binding cassette domain-containing protein n=1 Tax=Oenococcus sp. TaxID=1979414 RepID=UPI0039EAC7E3